MGIYHSVCFKVEDLFVKMLTKKQEPEEVKQKVGTYRKQQLEGKARHKTNRQAKA